MSKVIVGIVIIGVVLGGVWWWMSSRTAAPAPDQGAGTATAMSGTGTSSTTGAPMSANVTYDGNAFSPSTVTVMRGGTVTFTDATGQMWIASDPHPTHDGYDGTTRDQHCAAGYSGSAPFDQCAGGSSFSFTFDKAGSWGYHDHFNHGALGTVVVVAQ